jgi:hypothetical protein
MLLDRESTPSEAASSGPFCSGEEGWAKGSTLVGGLPGAPMILESQNEVEVGGHNLDSEQHGRSTISTPRRSWVRVQGVAEGPEFAQSGVEKDHFTSHSPLSPSSNSISLEAHDIDPHHARDREIKNNRFVETEENNNKDPQEKSQASSRSRILCELSVVSIVSSRKKRKNEAAKKKSIQKSQKGIIRGKTLRKRLKKETSA